MARLLPNSSYSPTLTLHSNQQANAACFSLSETRTVTQVSWYRSATSGQGAPTKLAIWRASDGAELWSTLVIPDNGAVGWQIKNITGGPSLTAGIEYRVGGCSPAGTNYALLAAGSIGTPEAPISWAATIGRFTDGSCVHPTSAGSGVVMFDITVEELPSDVPADTPASEIDIENALHRWLDPTNDLYRTTGDPAVIRGLLQDATSGLAAIKAKADALEAQLTAAQAAILDGAETGNDALESILVAALGPAGGMGTGAARTLIDALQAALQTRIENGRLAAGGPSAIAPPADAGWDVVATGAFAGSFHMTHRCDRLYLHITEVGGAMTVIDVEGFHFVNRPYWWLPVHSGNVGNYQTSRAMESCLLVPGMRVDGFLVVVPSDFEGTWEASIYNG